MSAIGLAVESRRQRRGFSQLLAEKGVEPEPLASEESTSEGESSEGVVKDILEKAAEETSDAPTEEEKEAFRLYEQKFAEDRDGSYRGYNRKAFPWFTPKTRGEVAQPDFLKKAMAAKDAPKVRAKKESEVDSDGEEVQLCCQCGLPVGETAYRPEEKDHRLVHAECMAQIVLQDAQDKDEKNVEEQRQKKLENRLEYQIGWEPSSVPKNSIIASKLGCDPVPQGLCSLVLDEASRTVRIASTLEPSASVNLEYLMLALKVRRTACREPLFSLDPVDPQNLESTPQMKRYEPAWLAGTSVGDIMFQADYFLKELALGEYTMPVVGMMSVFDWSELMDSTSAWAGREWFVVRKAEVRLAEVSRPQRAAIAGHRLQPQWLVSKAVLHTRKDGAWQEDKDQSWRPTRLSRTAHAAESPHRSSPRKARRIDSPGKLPEVVLASFSWSQVKDSTNCVWWIPVTSAVCHSGGASSSQTTSSLPKASLPGLAGLCRGCSAAIAGESGGLSDQTCKDMENST